MPPEIENEELSFAEIQKARGDFLEDLNSEEDDDEVISSELDDEEDTDNEDDLDDDEDENTSEDEDSELESDQDSEETDESDEELEDGEDDEEDSDSARETSKKPSHRIPKERFDEVVTQRNEARELAEKAMQRAEAAEERLTRIMALMEQGMTKKEAAAEVDSEQVKASEPVFSLDSEEYTSKVDEMNEALFSGELDKARKLNIELRKMEQQAYKAEMARVREEAETAAIQKIRATEDESKFNDLVADFMTKYPVFDQKSPDFNLETVKETNGLMEAFISSGVSKSEALTKAVDYVASKYGLNKQGESLGKTTKEESEDKAEKVAERKRNAVKRNTRAAKAQPARMRGKSMTDVDINEYDITRMSEKEFNELPDRVKRKLRGD